MYDAYLHQFQSEKCRIFSLYKYVYRFPFQNSYVLSLGIDCEIQWLYVLTPKLDGMSDKELLAKYIKGTYKSELNKLKIEHHLSCSDD